MPSLESRCRRARHDPGGAGLEGGREGSRGGGVWLSRDRGPCQSDGGSSRHRRARQDPTGGGCCARTGIGPWLRLRGFGGFGWLGACEGGGGACCRGG
ncbi:MAG TPA: hypothetical protein VFA92_09840, partial [Candidatus Binatia bacterium]|nr:hypothetical protein [Candidatus Binatia bacterium]